MNLPQYDFTGLRALFINCTLKRSPEPSNTQGLVDISTSIMTRHGVAVDVLRAVDYGHRHRRVARHARARFGH